MSAPALDERLVRDAVVAALPGVNVYDYGKVPGSKGPDGTTNSGVMPDNFALIALERTYVEPVRTTRRPSRSGWRLQLRYVGRTPDNARLTKLKVEAIDGEVLTVAGHEPSTPVVFESADRITPDEGKFSGESIYTFTF